MKLTQTIETEYEKVEEKKIDTLPTIEQSKSLEKLVIVWKEWTLKMVNHPAILSTYFLYDKAYHQIKNAKIEYTKEDITNLCAKLIVLQEQHPISERKKYLSGPSLSFGNAFGIFMSALVNKHVVTVEHEMNKKNEGKKQTYIQQIRNAFQKKTNQIEKTEETEQNKQINEKRKIEYTIHTNNPYEPINYVGFRNRGNTIIDGTVGDYAGLAMRSGTLHILGNCGKQVGCFMRGGTIILEKKYEKISGSIYCGKIVHKKNTIVQDSFNKKRRYI